MKNVLKNDEAISKLHAPSSTPYEFSLVVGGPLFQLVRRTHLSGDALELVRRRIIAITMFAWGPLLILSALNGRAWGAAVRVPFLLDAAVQLRMLLALPLLIGAELVLHTRIRLVIGQFMGRGLISETSRARFEAAIRSALQLRDSAIAEILLIAGAYLFTFSYLWPQYSALNVNAPTWFADPVGSGHRLTAAGWWRFLVSLPLFAFILFRWYFRLLVWIRLLWQVARCDLRLMPTHPDRVGGLGFLSLTPFAFEPFLAAHGVVLAGLMADQIFYHGAKLLDFKEEVGVVVGFVLLMVLAPLLLFVPHLAAAKRAGLRDYGSLAQRYMREFDDKWARGTAPADKPLLGSPDIQSLADLGTSFDVIRTMRLVPITRDALVPLLVVTLLPVAPLLLTVISPEEIMKVLFKALF
ncbi:MAG TPA: hypothetical protein VK466_09820 [Terriglobales bacterium]|nr:hypothetical protein [Terriglobales bacterium]